MKGFHSFRKASAGDVAFIAALESMPHSRFVHAETAATHTANLADPRMHYFICNDTRQNSLGFALLVDSHEDSLEWRRIVIKQPGFGAGRAFMVALISHFDAHGVGKIWLDVYKDNQPAHHCISRWGLEKRGESIMRVRRHAR